MLSTQALGRWSLAHHRHRPLTAALLVAFLLAAAAGCGSIAASAGTFTTTQPGVLTVATSAVPSAGFWEGTPSDPTGGFEYELAREFASRFGLGAVRVRIVHFHRIVRRAPRRRRHRARPDHPHLPTRRRYLEFSAPYLKAAPTVVVRSGTEVPDLATAQELRWGAVRSTTFVEDIEDSITPEQSDRRSSTASKKCSPRFALARSTRSCSTCRSRSRPRGIRAVASKRWPSCPNTRRYQSPCPRAPPTARRSIRRSAPSPPTGRSKSC